MQTYYEWLEQRDDAIAEQVEKELEEEQSNHERSKYGNSKD